MSSSEHSCNCAAVLKAKFREMDTEANVSPWTPDLAPIAPFEELGLICPHGVRWHAEPTTEQKLQWAKDGVR